jgi:hypothetical protein
MSVRRWLRKPGETFCHGDDLCELLIDGKLEVHEYLPGPNQTDPSCGIYSLMTSEGEQVGPWGHLLEYTDWPAGKPIPVRARQSRPRLYRRRERYPRIFLNYRRTDADAFAGRLHEALLNSFGADDVFMDIFSIRPGERSTWTIQQAVAHCEVMVCVIGTTWAGIRTPFDVRRLESPFDFVRREIVAAIDLGIAVIPVLLPGSTVPNRDVLPEDMVGLEDLQMLELSAKYWQAGTTELFSVIRSELSRAAESAGQP